MCKYLRNWQADWFLQRVKISTTTNEQGLKKKSCGKWGEFFQNIVTLKGLIRTYNQLP